MILLDPAEPGPVPGLRVFGQGADPELTADLILGVLQDLFRDSWGVRSSQYLRLGLTSLAHDPEATFGDLPFLFSDEAYRRRVVARLTDPLLLAAWEEFEQLRPAERSNQLGAPLQKLSELLGRRVLRGVLSQPRPTLDLREAMRSNRIVLVTLSAGRLGAPASRLLGALLVHALFNAVQARTALPEAARTPFLRLHRRAEGAGRHPDAARRPLRTRPRYARRGDPGDAVALDAPDAGSAGSAHQRGDDWSRSARRQTTPSCSRATSAASAQRRSSTSTRSR